MLPELELPAERDLPTSTQRAQREKLVEQAAAKRGQIRIGGMATVFAVVLLLAAAPALAFRERIVDLFSSADQARPAGGWSLPPRGAAPPALVRQMASRSNVNTSSLRKVAGVGTGRHHVELVIGVGNDGKLWVAQGGESWATQFVPLAGRVGPADAVVEYLRY